MSHTPSSRLRTPLHRQVRYEFRNYTPEYFSSNPDSISDKASSPNISTTSTEQFPRPINKIGDTTHSLLSRDFDQAQHTTSTPTNVSHAGSHSNARADNGSSFARGILGDKHHAEVMELLERQRQEVQGLADDVMAYAQRHIGNRGSEQVGITDLVTARGGKSECGRSWWATAGAVVVGTVSLVGVLGGGLLKDYGVVWRYSKLASDDYNTGKCIVRTHSEAGGFAQAAQALNAC